MTVTYEKTLGSSDSLYTSFCIDAPSDRDHLLGELD